MVETIPFTNPAARARRVESGSRREAGCEEAAMSERLGPMEIECDSPSYSIVSACQKLGFYSPEDVRWCRLSHAGIPATHWRELLRRPWQFLLGGSKSTEKACFCGLALPALEMCTFTLISGKEVTYVIGQCSRCHAIFWDEARSPF
jgi:hypothetical protein